MNTRRIASVAMVAAMALAGAIVAAQSYDTAALMKFRADRETTLKADNGWLTVAGLEFLNQGENRVGSDPSNDIVLDYPSVPKHAGVITMNGKSVRIRAAEGQTLTVNDKPVRESELHGAFDNKPQDTVSFGPVSFFVHYSGPRLALRVRDQKSALRTNFRGLRWYDPKPEYRVVGTFKPYPQTKTIDIPNILGDLEPFDAIGTVTFTLAGATHNMEAWKSGNQFWFVFRDLTSGRDTYHSARFLYTEPAVDGKVVMDFNYARNPPCAYNTYTTCPLPPAQNRLPVRIEAGELRYEGPKTPTEAAR